MAAKKIADTSDTNSNENQVEQPSAASASFEDFIAAQLQQQEKESRQTDNVDTAKRDNFIARAKAESERMNREIEKSQQKRDRLYAELGAARLSEWRNEHSAEVLTAQQAALVEQSYQQG
ncbi:hypothetical protein PoB_002632500 [Plakobranchus ocellatus]|uniref:Clathrin light chain n=1 Tax=Plakobranchus ocellatus TaxID=259542 RepID=A0AAV3ZYT7_9GAST|nr:hypothetical protein PoB_002632500 [Plakobranchus ocellatus]